MNRNLPITAGVALLHIACLWALHTALQRQAAEIVIPAEVLMEMLAAPNSEQKTPLARMEPARAAPKLVANVSSATRPRPTPAPSSEPPTPRPDTPPDATAATAEPTTPSAAASSAAPSTLASSGAPSQAQGRVAAAPAVEQPSSDADYLNNPKPPYPPLSKRLGEQGKVIVRALIGLDGTAHSVEIKQSSGFDRLDQVALATTLRWRYVPGKRGGVPEAMWFNLPFSFVLE